MAAAPDLTRFHHDAQAAAALIRSRPRGSLWLLSCDTDADGLCAAAVMYAALRPLGHRAVVRASRDKTEPFYSGLALEECDGHILLDKGTSHAAQLAGLAATTKRAVLIVDHHNLVDRVPEHPLFAMLNPRCCGLDGSRDASASTTAMALALALGGDAHLKLGPVALSGAIGDWQHMPAWQGWNLDLMTRCRGAGFIGDLPLPRFIGADLALALSHARPPVPGLDGDPEAAAQWLSSLGIPTEAEVEDLGVDERTRLASAIACLHLASGNPEAAGKVVAATEWNLAKDQGLRQVFRIVDACGREGEHATGIAYLLGDGSAAAQAAEVFKRYRKAVAAGVERLQKDGTVQAQSFQWAWTQRADYTGMVAGIGMMHAVADRARPLCILSKRPDGLVQVSTRGLPDQVERGLDLGRAVRIAATKVGAEGGGHPVAAGAVVPEGGVMPFLAALDEALAAQLAKSAGASAGAA